MERIRDTVTASGQLPPKWLEDREHGHTMKRFAALLALVLALLVVVPPLAEGAPPAGACTSAEPAHSTIVQEPWA
ncbi:hypothetical protein [Amycolatopsis sulphurea]|uniref:hypothetical protein n=1 Tax=Amycolatopsis sulphurea TaxID=76022 RepID=UPI003182E8C1